MASHSGTDGPDVLGLVLNPRMSWLIEFVDLLIDKVVGRLRKTSFIRFFGTELVVEIIKLRSMF